MNIVDEHTEELAALARRHGVARLELFGSAASGAFDPETSDLDFLVEFKNPGPEGKFNTYFGLLNDLTALFGRPVDLVSNRAITNPYFLKSVNETRRPVYVA
jgi:predicted nucleotidyltransferase